MLTTRAIPINRALTQIFGLVAHTTQERNESAPPSRVKYPSTQAKKVVQMPPHEQHFRVRCSHPEFQSALPSSARETMNRYDLGWSFRRQSSGSISHSPTPHHLAHNTPCLQETPGETNASPPNNRNKFLNSACR